MECPPNESPLILDQTEAQRAEKKFCRDLGPPLSQSVDDLADPYLKAWMRHRKRPL